MNAQQQTVQFHGKSISVFTQNNQHYVAMKPICENIGLDWRAQRQRIMRNEIMKQGVVIITTPDKTGQMQETNCLPLDYLNGWLFGVDANRVKPEIKPRLLQYQRECFKVLNAHFNKPIEPPRTALPAVVDQLPHRNELIQVVMMLGDRLKEIHNWGSGNFNEHIRQHMRKNYTECTYQELVSLIRKLHRETQTVGGKPIVAGHRHRDSNQEAAALNDMLIVLNYSLRLMRHTQEMARYLKFLDSRVLLTMTTTVQEMRRPMRHTLQRLEEMADALPGHYSADASFLQQIKRDFTAAFPPAVMPPCLK